MAFVVVYDACVLYPLHLRDVLMRVSIGGLVQARWSKDILDEAFSSLARRLACTCAEYRGFVP